MKSIYCLAVSLLLFLLTACEHKELCYDHVHTAQVKVVFDWKHAPQARPASMRLYLFSADGSRMIPYEFGGRDGGYITVPGGNYRALCINNDAESVMFTGVDRFEDFMAYTANTMAASLPRSASDRAAADEESVHRSPGMLWTDRAEDINIVLGKQEQTITLFPDTSVCRYTVEIRNVKNVEGLSASAFSGALTGISEGFMVGRNRLSEKRVTIPFEFELAIDGTSTLTADFLAFGHVKDGRTRHWLYVYVRMPEGRKFYYAYDVTDQLMKAANPRHVHIILDGPSLPKPINSGGAVLLHVDEWEEIAVDIRM